MFEGWSFLLGEIWVLLALAGLVGLAAGWLIGSGTGSTAPLIPDEAALKAARETGRAECRAKLKEASATLSRAKKDAARRDARLKALESEIDSLRSELAFNPPSRTDDLPEDEAPPEIAQDKGHEAETGARPVSLAAPRDSGADDLTQIRGIGPKLRDLCHGLGIYHFDQIAAWSAAEVAWMDANLVGFKGRVTRDDWVAQARTLVQPK